MKEITQAQIENWKKQHGDVYKYTAKEKSCFLKRPDRKILSYANTVAGNDPMKFNEILLENCFIGGDEEIKTNDAYFMGVSSKLGELIQIEVGELEKL
jgi:hypothetical protein